MIIAKRVLFASGSSIGCIICTLCRLVCPVQTEGTVMIRAFKIKVTACVGWTNWNDV